MLHQPAAQCCRRRAACRTACCVARPLLQPVRHARAPQRAAAAASAVPQSSPSATAPPGPGVQPQQQPRRSIMCAASRISTGSKDVVGTYRDVLTAKVRDLARQVRKAVPEKADEVMSEDEQEALRSYIHRFVDLLLLELDEEVQEFVVSLKDWPLRWLQDDGRVLLGLDAAPAGEYYGQDVVRFFLPPTAPSSGRQASRRRISTSDGEDELPELPRCNLGPGNVVLVTTGEKGPLVGGGLCDDMLTGVVIERSRKWVKVAFEAAPERDELECKSWRLDKSVNTLTTEKALLALLALWHRVPFTAQLWHWPSLSSLGKNLLATVGRLFHSSSSSSGDSSDDDEEEAAEAGQLFKRSVQRTVDALDAECRRGRREHSGVFEGSAVSGIIVGAHSGFDWGSLPASAGGMPGDVISRNREILPATGRPNEAATAALLRRMEARGQLGTSSAGGMRLDASQMQAIATAVLNPLALLHGPPGTGKTTTLSALIFFLRRLHGYKGKILASAQSNVAVDNMLETALKGGLKVVRVGEPAKVRSCLRARTLRALTAEATEADADIKEAKAEHQRLLKKLQRAKRSRPDSSGYLSGREKYEIYERLDSLRARVDAATKQIARRLLAEADVVGVTCTGAAGPELEDAGFDMVIIDEGSQASEPEALTPIMKGAQRVVLVGDHKQLPPVVKNRAADAAGFSKSLFERLMDLGAPSAMLQVQYRSHPDLMAFINEQYYHSLLSNGVNAAARPAPRGFPFPNPSVPILFIDVDGKEASSARGSKANDKEAGVIADCVHLLVRECGMAPFQLGIISPYAAQVALMSKRLQKRGYTTSSAAGGDDSWNELEIKSVDGYQGREKEVILLSTVRANINQEVGFLDEWRRANVALSRARCALVVVGHRGTLRGSKTWRPFLDHVAARQCVVKLKHVVQHFQVAFWGGLQHASAVGWLCSPRYLRWPQRVTLAGL